MLELLMPATREQEGPMYDTDLRPSLVVDEVRAIREAGVTPGAWKLEGFERREDCEAVSAVAGAPCVVLGRGQDDEAVGRWLRAAGGVDGWAGFAIGRTIWWDPLRRLVDGGSREGAVAAIAASYARFVEVARDAALGG
jgi:myo-inositol catabolism protein IolC